MKPSSILLGLSLSSYAHGLLRRNTLQSSNSPNSTSPHPKRYIVEFEQDADHIAIQKRIAAHPGTTILKVFDTDLFRGLSVESTSHNVDTLSDITSVAQVWISKIIRLDTPTPVRTWKPSDVAAGAASSNYSVHAQTGVDKLHAQDIYGEGVVIAIVDTGTQYTHPALGGCLGATCKVAGGYDLVGDGCWPETGCTIEPDNDPMDDIGHGTHVAGIVVGQSVSGPDFVGVAPKASILSYKVFTNYDGTTEDVLIEAFLMAYEADVDIITSSIGGAGGWASDAWAVVASRIADQGVIVTIAAGNDGEEGPYYASDGSSGDKVLAVASVEAIETAEIAFLANFTLNNQTSSAIIGYYEGFEPIPYTYTGFPIYAISLDTNATDDACEPLSVNLTGKVVLVRVGDCDGSTQQKHIQDAGAHVTLFYLGEDHTAIPDYSFTGGFTGVISQASGLAIINILASGGDAIVDFTTYNSNNYFVGMLNPSGASGMANYYSSWGPLYDSPHSLDTNKTIGSIYIQDYIRAHVSIISMRLIGAPQELET